ncbi:response regulator [candidate division KSB1 bacterium]|nr:response regulator [candidate division KSB1 bacterium]
MRDAGKRHDLQDEQPSEQSKVSSSNRKQNSDDSMIDVQQYQSFFTTTIEGIADFKLIADISGEIHDYQFLDVNPPFEAITGKDKSVFINKKGSDVFGSSPPPFLAVFTEVARSGRPLSFETYFKEIRQNVQITAFSTAKHVVTILMRELPSKSASFNTLAELQHAADARKKELNCLYAALHTLDQTNISLDDKLYHIANLIPSAFPQSSRIAVRLTLYKKKYLSEAFEVSSQRFRLPFLDGKVAIGSIEVFYSPFATNNSPTVFTEEKISFLETIAIQINKSILYYMNRSDQQRLSGSMESIQYGVITTTSGGAINFMNPVAERFTSCRCQDVIGKPLSSVFNVLSVQNRVPLTLDCHKLYSQEQQMFQCRALLISASQREYIIDINAAPIRNMNNELTECAFLFHDITHVYKKTETVMQQQKLTSLSLLAGGLAHDFNNILMTVLGNISLAKMDITEDHPIYPILVKAEQKALKARELTIQLLSFSDRGTPIKREKALGELIQEIVYHFNANQEHQIKLKIPPGLWLVEVDPAQIETALHQIILNAMQAQQNGGDIHIMARNCTINSESVLPLESGFYTCISIKDSGEGIPDTNIHKIFDPYFTTREKHSGLGLATVYSIVKNHNGNIIVESESGKGSTFHVYLPASNSSQRYRRTRTDTMITERGKILLMDDEDTVLETAARMLKKLGFEVVMTRNGSEAVEQFRELNRQASSLQAAILDLSVPGGMGGKEAVQEMLKIDPDVKVLVSSGFTQDPVMSDFHQFGFSGIIMKPYKLDELHDAIDKLADCD